MDQNLPFTTTDVIFEPVQVNMINGSKKLNHWFRRVCMLLKGVGRRLTITIKSMCYFMCYHNPYPTIANCSVYKNKNDKVHLKHYQWKHWIFQLNCSLWLTVENNNLTICKDIHVVLSTTAAQMFKPNKVSKNYLLSYLSLIPFSFLP